MNHAHTPSRPRGDNDGGRVGEARGIRVAEITTRIVQVIEVPRSLLSDFLKNAREL